MAIDGQVCYHKQLFANPVKPPRYTTGSVGQLMALIGMGVVPGVANDCLDLSFELSLFLSLSEDTALMSVS